MLSLQIIKMEYKAVSWCLIDQIYLYIFSKILFRIETANISGFDVWHQPEVITVFRIGPIKRVGYVPKWMHCAKENTVHSFMALGILL